MHIAAARADVQNGGRRRAGRPGYLCVEAMQIAATAVQLIGRRHRRLTCRLPPPPESLAPARLGFGATALSPILALTGGPNSLFIREESTLKRESIFLSLLCELYSTVGRFFWPPRWMMSRFSIPTGEALIVVHP